MLGLLGWLTGPSSLCPADITNGHVYSVMGTAAAVSLCWIWVAYYLLKLHASILDMGLLPLLPRQNVNASCMPSF